MIKTQIRVLKSGALRDTDNGKFEYLGFMEPYNDYSFAKFMHKHRLLPDGTMRASNNWQKGFGREVTIQSLVRHVEDLKLLYTGYFVYEFREGGKAERIVLRKKLKKLPKNYKEIDVEECCNAIRFNVEAFKKEYLAEKEAI
jgi:hypothetical protein